jgi:hypothetical protein
MIDANQFELLIQEFCIFHRMQPSVCGRPILDLAKHSEQRLTCFAAVCWALGFKWLEDPGTTVSQGIGSVFEASGAAIGKGLVSTAHLVGHTLRLYVIKQRKRKTERERVCVCAIETNARY